LEITFLAENILVSETGEKLCKGVRKRSRRLGVPYKAETDGVDSTAPCGGSWGLVLSVSQWQDVRSWKI
jgi:hypothetical protein